MLFRSVWLSAYRYHAVEEVAGIAFCSDCFAREPRYNQKLWRTERCAGQGDLRSCPAGIRKVLLCASHDELSARARAVRQLASDELAAAKPRPFGSQCHARLAAHAGGATEAEMRKVIARVWRLHDEADCRNWLA